MQFKRKGAASRLTRSDERMPPQVTNWQYDASRDYIVDARQSRQSLSFQKRVVERVTQEPVARLRVVSEASNLAQLNRILKAIC